MFAFSFLPQVLLFVGQTLVSKDGSLAYVRDNAEILWQVPVAVAVLAVYYAAAIFGVTIISSIVAVILEEADALGGRGTLFNVLALPLEVRDLIFLGHIHQESDLAGVAGAGALALVTYLAVLGLSLGVLFWRYRWAEA